MLYVSFTAFNVLWLRAFLSGGTASAEDGAWYVSQSGSYLSTCGRTEDQPCANLSRVLERSRSGETVYVDGGGEAPEPTVYQVCLGDRSINSVRIVGLGGSPRLKCHRHEAGGVLRFSSVNKLCSAWMENVQVEDGSVLIANCSLTVVNSTFQAASVVSLPGCRTVSIHITNSTWVGHHTCDDRGICYNHHLNNITCAETEMVVQDSNFYQTAIFVVSYEATNILINGSKFSNLPSQPRFLGGVHLTFSANRASVVITRSVFEDQIHPTRILSVVNLYDSAIWLKAAVTKTKNGSTANKAHVRIDDCRFVNNERALTAVGYYEALHVEHCDFRRNMAMHAGAAILVLTTNNTRLVVYACTFTENVAGRYRDTYPAAQRNGSFEVVGGEVHLNADCCKGVISLVGKGGAIRIQRGKVTIVNSRFVNNGARLLGGSVFVDIDGNLVVLNTYFENTRTHDHAMQGDVIYSDGKMTINEVELIVRSATNGLSILRHSGDHWSLDITNVWIQCPVGYDLRANNSSAYGVTGDGLRRSYKLDQLSYFCESCARNKYSLDYGYLNYTIVFVDFAYFTLLINGSVPKPQYTGKYIHHKIQCDDCPYGGHCVQGITAHENFWGYKHGSSIRFQHCPSGYCMTAAKPSSVNTCMPNRYGRLCGRCQAGYSEALFSAVCVTDEQCGPTWLVPLALAFGLFYALFLLFQPDLKQFLFSPTVSNQFLVARWRHAKHKVHLNGRATKVEMRLPDIETEDGTTAHLCADVDEDDDSSRGGEKTTTTAPNGEVCAGDDVDDGVFRTTDCGSGYLIILFYYFQDALLLKVKTVLLTGEGRRERQVKSVLFGLFKLQFELIEFIDGVCAASGMTGVPKMMTKALIVPYIILIFATMYALYRWARVCRWKRSTRRSSKETTDRKSVTTRLASGFILALMFMFQKMGTTTFTLLNCVPVDDGRVLFIDGTVTCYQYWQYGVMAYAVSCVTPFFIVLLVGPPLMQRGYIGLRQFFAGCLCPLPLSVYWVGKWAFGRRRRRWRPLREDERAVVNLLQGPFKDDPRGGLGSACWAGVLIGRRLVLVLLFTFVNDTLVRLLLMLLACFLILLHHVHVQPYKDARANIAGTASAAALVALGSINLVRAGFEAAEYTPTGPNAVLMKIFLDIENALLLWLPVCVLLLLILLLLFRIAVWLGGCTLRTRTSRANGEEDAIQLN